MRLQASRWRLLPGHAANASLSPTLPHCRITSRGSLRQKPLHPKRSEPGDVGGSGLTDRERAVLRLAQDGRSNKEVGRALELSPGTVRNYLSEAAAKLGASNRIEASRIAREQGWL
nr:LuxR C-terminal-related transcriptional regulator [Sphingomonas psychrotolerans]